MSSSDDVRKRRNFARFFFFSSHIPTNHAKRVERMGVLVLGKGWKRWDEERMDGNVDGQVVMTTGLL